MFENNPGNVQEDSGECSKRFKGMFKKIPGNVQEDSRECSRRFRVMLKKISGDLNLDTFCEILLIFNQILQIAKNTKEYFLRYYILGNYKIQSIKNYTQSFKIVLYKKVFFQILQISQEVSNICVGVSMEISMESLSKKVAGRKPEGLQIC